MTTHQTPFDQAVDRLARTADQAQEARESYLKAVAMNKLAIEDLERVVRSEANIKVLESIGPSAAIEATRQAMILRHPESWSLAIGYSRSEEACRWRRIAVQALLLASQDMTLATVGLVLGRRHHTTIIYLRDRVTEDEVRIAEEIQRAAHGIHHG